MLNNNRDTATATIASGASLSGAVDLGGYRLHAILMPAAWTAASLTFQGSPDGTTYSELFDSSGTAETFTVAASRLVYVPAPDRFNFRSLKVRSGTSGAPTNQGADRALTLILAP